MEAPELPSGTISLLRVRCPLASSPRRRQGNGAPRTGDRRVVNVFVADGAGASNALPVDLALELIDGLLGARPVRVHVEQLLERLERRLLLADLAQDLAEPVECLEVMGVQGERAPQIAQRALDVILREVYIRPAVPGLREVGRQLDDVIEQLERQLDLLVRHGLDRSFHQQIYGGAAGMQPYALDGIGNRLGGLLIVGGGEKRVEIGKGLLSLS